MSTIKADPPHVIRFARLRDMANVPATGRRVGEAAMDLVVILQLIGVLPIMGMGWWYANIPTPKSHPLITHHQTG